MSPTPFAPPGSPRPVRVHVCIDQGLSDASASGLVNAWCRLWEQAARHPDLDITAHVPGRRPRTQEIAANVRIREHPRGSLATALLERAGLKSPAQVGLLPFHAGLARALADADVIHTTYTLFTFAMTALRVAERRRVPLITSLQTQVPQYAEIYAWQFARRVLPHAAAGRRGEAFSRRVRQALEAQARWYFARCSRVMLSSDSDLESLPRGYPMERVARFDRGIDTEFFTPAARDRAFLRSRFGVADGVPVLVYVGKLMPEKNLGLLATALAKLRREGRRFALIACGAGELQGELARRLGDAAIFPGVQPHAVLRRLYASADVFAFPSATETYGQVVMEAMCCGLAPVVSARGGAAQHVRPSGEVGLVVERDVPSEWTSALRAMLDDLPRCRRMGVAARRRAEATYRGWGQIFDEAVKPVWLEAVGERRGSLPARRRQEDILHVDPVPQFADPGGGGDARI